MANITFLDIPGCVAQSVMCLTTDTCLSADQEVTSSIPIPYFCQIDHDIICTAILPPSADSNSVVVSDKRKYVREVLGNCLVKLAQEKSVV